MRSTVLALAAVSAAAVVPATAVAAPPDISLPPGDTGYQVIDDRCGFEMEISVSGKEGSIAFDDHQRGIFPGTTAVFTNIETGETYTHDLSGPAVLTVIPDGDGGATVIQEGTGNWAHAHGDDIFLTSGRFVETRVFDATLGLIDVELDYSTARVTSLCELLS